MTGESARWPDARRLLAGMAGLLALLAAVAGTSRPRPRAPGVDVVALASDIEREADHVTARELAAWIRARRPGLRVIDVRSDSEFQGYHVPSAERIPLPELARLAPSTTETLVLYSEGGAHAAQGWVLLKVGGHPRVYFLRGGLLEWMDDVMSPALAAGDTADAALSRYFGGTPHVGVAPPGAPRAAGASSPHSDAAALDSAVARRRRKGC